MQTAKLFANGQSQAVRLPKEYRFNGSEVYIKKIGDAVMLFPIDRGWDIFMEGIDSFSADFMEDGRLEAMQELREQL